MAWRAQVGVNWYPPNKKYIIHQTFYMQAAPHSCRNTSRAMSPIIQLLHASACGI